MAEKLSWEGTVESVQPRIRLLRSFDQRSHSYLGYVLLINGVIDNETRHFRVAVGKAAHAKHQFRVGDRISGKAEPVVDQRLETAEYYKITGLKILDRTGKADSGGPPWQGPAPALEVYRERRHRRLHPTTYEAKCVPCIWGCRMPVEIVVDHWNPGQRRYRYETFCYGPKSCPFYRAGVARKVPGRKGMTWEEADWVDEEETAHRDWDD